MVLLIEPVWNRNWCTGGPKFVYGDPFNRTSMESKQSQHTFMSAATKTFNRTSMESKHPTTVLGDSDKVDF